MLAILAFSSAHGLSQHSLVTMGRADDPSQADEDITANPGRPALATSALLTPLARVQSESGLLFASDSAQFSRRIAEEQTMRLTVTGRLQFIVSAEPAAYSQDGTSAASHEGDMTGGAQLVLNKGAGIRPTFAVSYLRLIRGGSATDLDIGAFVNSAVLQASNDLGHFHVDANFFASEQQGKGVRRGMFGEAIAVSQPLTARLAATGELRHFSQPLTGGETTAVMGAAAYSLRPNLVFDLGLVRGLTATSTRWQVASGITYVLPRRLWGQRQLR